MASATQVKDGNGRFCSKACVAVFRSQNGPRQCLTCDATFCKPPSLVGEFCSRACYNGDIRSARMRGKNLGAKRTLTQLETMKRRKHRGTTPVVTRSCLQCGQTFGMGGKVAARDKDRRRFCTHACFYTWLRDDPSRSASYKGATVPDANGIWPDKLVKSRLKTARYQARYQARKRAAWTGERIVRAVIIARDHSSCYLCDKVLVPGVDRITLDHVIPLTRGGPHSTANLRVACNHCNIKKRMKLLSELRQKAHA